jgi:hypothetical protein
LNSVRQSASKSNAEHQDAEHQDAEHQDAEHQDPAAGPISLGESFLPSARF